MFVGPKGMETLGISTITGNLCRQVGNMVCISCIVVPVVLYIWHRFLQPLVARFWNPWGAVEASSASKPAAEPLKCPFSDGGVDTAATSAGAAGEKSAAAAAAAPVSGHAEHIKGD